MSTWTVRDLRAEAVPGISQIAYLWNAAHGRIGNQILKEMQGAAQALSVALQSVEVRGDKDFEPAFLAVRRGRPDGLIVLGEPLTGKHRARIVDFALTHRLPLMAHGPRVWPEAGALMSYAPVYPAMFHRAAHLVDKILRGTKPADLPVELPTRYDFVVNLKTAKCPRPHEPAVRAHPGG